ncbi:hypothetical protein ABSA28_00828 [Candidatus Hepatincolaceae symbiont of Richtersius coronifer]
MLDINYYIISDTDLVKVTFRKNKPVTDVKSSSYAEVEANLIMPKLLTSY